MQIIHLVVPFFWSCSLILQKLTLIAASHSFWNHGDIVASSTVDIMLLLSRNTLMIMTTAGLRLQNAGLSPRMATTLI